MSFEIAAGRFITILVIALLILAAYLVATGITDLLWNKFGDSDHEDTLL
jgi:hypothetical protein